MTSRIEGDPIVPHGAAGGRHALAIVDLGPLRRTGRRWQSNWRLRMMGHRGCIDGRKGSLFLEQSAQCGRAVAIDAGLHEASFWRADACRRWISGPQAAAVVGQRFTLERCAR
jgi:hypothetical protein